MDNGKPVAPADVLRHAYEDCVDYKALAFEGEGEGQQLFHGFALTLKELSMATTREQVNSIIYGLARQCIAYIYMRRALPVPVPVARSEVESELASIKAWSAQFHQLMGPLQDEKNDMEDGGLDRAQPHRFKVLRESIEKLATLAKPVEARKTVLEHYLASLSVAERGVPACAGKLPEFPEIEEAQSEEPVQVAAPAPAPAPAPAAEPPAPIIVGGTLAEIAEKAGFHPAEVLAYTLYELFGAKNHVLGGRHRGVMRVLECAADIGIAKRLGFPSFAALIKGSQWKDTRGFLLYCGSVKGSSTFKRTDKPLPWKVPSLLTEQEARSFIAEMKEPVREADR